MSNVRACCVGSVLKSIVVSPALKRMLLLSGVALIAVGAALSLTAILYSGVGLLGALVVISFLTVYLMRRHKARQSALCEQVQQYMLCENIDPFKQAIDDLDQTYRIPLVKQCLQKQELGLTWAKLCKIDLSKYFENRDDQELKSMAASLLEEYVLSGLEGDLRLINQNKPGYLEQLLQPLLQEKALKCVNTNNAVELETYSQRLNDEGREKLFTACLDAGKLDLAKVCGYGLDKLSDEDFERVTGQNLLAEYVSPDFERCLGRCSLDRRSQINEKVQGLLQEKAKECVSRGDYLGLGACFRRLSTEAQQHEVFQNCIGAKGGIGLLKRSGIALERVFAELSLQAFSDIDWQLHLEDLAWSDLDALGKDEEKAKLLGSKIRQYQEDQKVTLAAAKENVHRELRGEFEWDKRAFCDRLDKAHLQELIRYVAENAPGSPMVTFLYQKGYGEVLAYMSDDAFNQLDDRCVWSEWSVAGVSGTFALCSERKKQIMVQRVLQEVKCHNNYAYLLRQIDEQLWRASGYIWHEFQENRFQGFLSEIRPELQPAFEAWVTEPRDYALKDRPSSLFMRCWHLSDLEPIYEAYERNKVNGKLESLPKENQDIIQSFRSEDGASLLKYFALYPPIFGISTSREEYVHQLFETSWGLRALVAELTAHGFKDILRPCRQKKIGRVLLEKLHDHPDCSLSPEQLQDLALTI